MICEFCGKEHNGSYGSGRFCSSKCARAFSTAKDNKGTKKAVCVECGKTFDIDKRASSINYLCKECRIKKRKEELSKNNDYKSTDKYVKCNICGKIYHKSEGGCSNPFCMEHRILGFKNLIRYFGFDETKLGTEDVENEYNRIRNIIYKLYWEDGLSAEEIAKRYKFPSKHSIAQTVFVFLNIPRRSFKESTKNAIKTGRMPILDNYNQYKGGKHVSWEGKEFLLRSSYEFDYAKELDEKRIKYDVEALRIKYFNTSINEYCVAIPDFYLSETNMIVEIKSNWTLNLQEMKDKVKAYKELGYNFKLVLEHEEADLYSIKEERIHPKKKKFSIYRIMGSAYGTCWVHNDIENKKIKKEKLDEFINNGWIKGRKMNLNKS